METICSARYHDEQGVGGGEGVKPLVDLLSNYQHHFKVDGI